LTLTAASHVVFAELDWVPGNVSQAEDRLHRIGQRDSVLVQHLVFDDSVDSRMAHVIVEKQAVIDQALDDPTRRIELSPEQQEAIAAAARPVIAAVSNNSIPDDATVPF
jgi:SNF2 family DNA or RNA helicase